MQILVIEDEPRILSFLARGLEAEGFSVHGAGNGYEGLRRALDHAYDLLILDLLLPGLDGLSVLARLREGEPRPACRVLILSASLDEQVERAAGAAGAAGCIGKDNPRADICAEALRLARQ